MCNSQVGCGPLLEPTAKTGHSPGASECVGGAFSPSASRIQVVRRGVGYFAGGSCTQGRRYGGSSSATGFLALRSQKTGAPATPTTGHVPPLCAHQVSRQLWSCGVGRSRPPKNADRSEFANRRFTKRQFHHLSNCIFKRRPCQTGIMPQLTACAGHVRPLTEREMADREVRC